MNKSKKNICMLLAIVIMMTTFMSYNITAEAAKPKNTSYYVECTGVKSFKKSHGKLSVKAKKHHSFFYETSTGIYGTSKVSYKIAKKCKWSISDPEEEYYMKSSYKKIKKLIKQLDDQCVLTIKIRKGKIVRVNISTP